MASQIQPYQIVLDTNVLIAGLRSTQGASYKLLTLLNDQRWRLNVSVALVFEYEEVLTRQRERLDLTAHEINTLINGICAIANHCSIFYLQRPLSSDPNDDFLIDLAITAQADFIITYNQSDLQQVERFGILVLSPKEFLQRMGELE